MELIGELLLRFVLTYIIVVLQIEKGLNPFLFTCVVSVMARGVVFILSFSRIASAALASAVFAFVWCKIRTPVGITLVLTFYLLGKQNGGKTLTIV